VRYVTLFVACYGAGRFSDFNYTLEEYVCADGMFITFFGRLLLNAIKQVEGGMETGVRGGLRCRDDF
jgi:hypothetical protein